MHPLKPLLALAPNQSRIVIVVIRFSKDDSGGLYDDLIVDLGDRAHLALIERLHKALPRPRSDKEIRSLATPALAPTPDSQFPMSEYEMDYQKAAAKLCSISWQTLSLQDVAFLSAYRGCMSAEEHRYLIPFFLEIMLRASRYADPFESMLSFVDLREHRKELVELHQANHAREAIVDSLVIIGAKFAELEKMVQRVCRAWTAVT